MTTTTLPTGIYVHEYALIVGHGETRPARQLIYIWNTSSGESRVSVVHPGRGERALLNTPGRFYGPLPDVFDVSRLPLAAEIEPMRRREQRAGAK